MVVKKINLVWIFLWASLLFSCRKKTEKKAFTERIPKEAAYVLHVNTPDFFQSERDYFLHMLRREKLAEVFRRDSVPAGSTFNFIISSRNSEPFLVAVFPPDFLRGTVKKTLTFNGHSYELVTWRDYSFYRLRLSGNIIISDKESAVRKIIRSGNDYWESPETTNRYLHYTNTEADAHWFWFPANTPNNGFVPVSYVFLAKHLGKVYLWDMESAGIPQYTGVVLQEDEENNFFRVFADLPPSKPDILPMIHPGAKRFVWFNVASFPVFVKRWYQYKSFIGYAAKPVPPGLKSLKSIAEVTLKNKEKYLITNRFLSTEKLSAYPVASVYHDTEIYRTTDSTVLSSVFYPLLKKQAYPYVFLLGERLIWTASVETSRSIIDVFESGRNPVLADKGFAPAWKKLPDKISLALYDDGKIGFASVMEKDFFTGFYAGSGTNQAGRNKSQTWKILASIRLPALPRTAPQWIYNHRSKQYEIVYQDKLNRITLVTPEGKIRWQRNVDAPILGKIYPVDMFRNGKTQLLFATAKGLYIIDILGNYVRPFPLALQVSGPVSLFDYEHNKHYRIMVPAGKKLTMYNVRGEKVKGFREVYLDSDLQYQAQHLRIGTKDYLFVQEKIGRLRILNRRGEIRIPFKGRFSLKTGRWFTYKGGFVSLTKDGKIVRIHTNGKKDYLSFKPGILSAYFKDNRFILRYPDSIITDKGIAPDFVKGTSVKIVRSGNKYYYIVENPEEARLFTFHFDALGHPVIHSFDRVVQWTDRPQRKRWVFVRKSGMADIVLH